MPYGFSHTSSNYSDAYWGERPPRNASRSEARRLNLFDAGHGDQDAINNSILKDLGLTVVLDLNQYARSFTVTLEYEAGSVSKDITSLFKQITAQRYEMMAVAGDEDTLGFSGITENDYESGVTFKITVTTTNIVRRAVQEYFVYVAAEPIPVRGCATENVGDFEMFEQFQRAKVRIWRHIGSLDYDPSGSQQITFWFDESELLMTVESGILCPFFNYFTDYHNGIILTRDISAEDYDADYTIEDLDAGFNAWNGTNVCSDTLETIDEGC